MSAVTMPLQSGFRSHLGIVITHVSPERVLGQMLIDETLLNDIGIAHGGALMSLADELGARGAIACLSEGHTTSTIESKTNFLQRCLPGLVRGEAIPLHVGRTTMVWQTTISDSAGRRVAIVTQTQIVLREQAPREAPRPQPANLARPSANSTSAAESRRGDIIRHASRIMGSKGFANATMKEIAAAAGMHVPTMYQYVRSKDELLFLICDDCFENLNLAHDAAVDASAGAADRLKAAMESLINCSETYRAQLRLILRETPMLEPDVRIRAHARWNAFVQRFAAIIEDGVRSGEFDPVNADIAAHMIQCLCEMWAVRRVLLRRHGLEPIRSAILQLVLNGIGHREAT